MSQLTLRLLGSPFIELDGRVIRLSRHKALALLVYLALTKRSHSRDTLATLFWPDLDQSHARAGLRRALSLLNRTLGSEWFAIDRETAGWSPKAKAWLDVDVLRQRLTACAAHGHPSEEVCPACVPLLTQAVELYRDSFLAGFTLPDSPAFDEWQFFETEGLRDELAGTLQRLARWHGTNQEYETAIPYARRWLALDPLHESAHRELMTLYACSGQRAAALRQYGECERVLAEEMGIAPTAETIQLYQAIRQKREWPPAIPAKDAVTSEPPPPRQHNLPVPSTPFVGREKELTELNGLLSDPDMRLVTVLGPGGIGKTRLALEAAARHIARHTHGVWFASLAAVESVDAIVHTVAQTLGFSFYAGNTPRQQLLEYLRGKRMLLVLDNWEHLLEGVDLLADLLSTAPGIHVLATSRARLNLMSEQTLTLGGMDYPEPVVEAEHTPSLPDDLRRYSSVVLFLRSARRAHSGRKLSDKELPHVARICQLVQGMPLAILLAAAWVPLLTPAEIATEVERGLDFLAADWQDEPERHHSMRAVLDSTWAMLTETEQDVFARLSVFRGGFTREGAQTVTGSDLRTLMTLINKSLLYRDRNGRYGVHELLRQYAEEKLSETPTERAKTYDLHCAYYAEFLHRRETHLWKGDLQETLLEIDNVRAAWHWATLHRKVTEIRKYLPSLVQLYQSPGLHREGESIYAKAVDALRTRQAEEQSEEREAALGVALVLQGYFSTYLGHSEKGQELVQQSLSLLRKLDARRELAYSYGVAVATGALIDLSEARQLLEESLVISRELDDYLAMPRTLWLLGRIALHQEAYQEAEQYCREALEMSRRTDDRFDAAYALVFWGHTVYQQKEYARARQYYEESLALFQEIGHQLPIGRLYTHLGDVALALYDYEEARKRHHQALARYQDLGVYWKKDPVIIGGSWGISVSLQTLGNIALATGNEQDAKQYYRRALETARDKPYVELRLHVLLGPARLYARKGNVERAVRLAALARHHPESIEETKEMARALLDELQADPLPDLLAVAQEKNQAGDLEATVQELLSEMEAMMQNEDEITER
jgi:predicted ATPase/DNA-binding SARP family transcriptional activator/Tfp pilus assembly protein PilF